MMPAEPPGYRGILPTNFDLPDLSAVSRVYQKNGQGGIRTHRGLLFRIPVLVDSGVSSIALSG